MPLRYVDRKLFSSMLARDKCLVAIRAAELSADVQPGDDPEWDILLRVAPSQRRLERRYLSSHWIAEGAVGHRAEGPGALPEPAVGLILRFLQPVVPSARLPVLENFVQATQLVTAHPATPPETRAHSASPTAARSQQETSEANDASDLSMEDGGSDFSLATEGSHPSAELPLFSETDEERPGGPIQWCHMAKTRGRLHLVRSCSDFPASLKTSCNRKVLSAFVVGNGAAAAAATRRAWSPRCLRYLPTEFVREYDAAFYAETARRAILTGDKDAFHDALVPRG